MMPTWMIRPLLVALFVALSGLIAAPALAQKGTGERAGMAASGERPAVTALQGVVAEVKEGPCEQTTGRSLTGTHLIVETESGPVNLHLGPTPELQALRGSVDVGTEIRADAFQTDRLPPDAYVAVAVTAGDETFRLRDAETLRPQWAGQRGCRGQRHHDRHHRGRHGGCCW
jgi:hypothetical protein